METDGRWDRQAELVQRITSITTKAVPNDRGVALRFINANILNADNLDSDAVAQRIRSVRPDGATPIGTQLREKILKPLVYSVIDSGKKLECPYLVIVMTDGCPWREPDDQFRNAVAECCKYLEAKGYKKDGK